MHVIQANGCMHAKLDRPTSGVNLLGCDWLRAIASLGWVLDKQVEEPIRHGIAMAKGRVEEGNIAMPFVVRCEIDKCIYFRIECYSSQTANLAGCLQLSRTSTEPSTGKSNRSNLPPDVPTCAFLALAHYTNTNQLNNVAQRPQSFQPSSPAASTTIHFQLELKPPSRALAPHRHPWRN
jgi:hypothetical protein